ncbi:hypothetical protein NMY22_g1849 [Coprinellus aureogranulatus]|nr:hypothetical protein NMY22_g1849 [Coprinellus aureogranulatus]
MSSPNLPVLPHGSEASLTQALSPSTPSSVVVPSPDRLQFRDVPALPYLVLQRCGRRFQVRNGSLQHATVTGNLVSPTPIGSQPRFDTLHDAVTGRWNIDPVPTVDASCSLPLRRSTRNRRPSYKLRAMLSSSPGDVAEAARYRCFASPASPHISLQDEDTASAEASQLCSPFQEGPVPTVTERVEGDLSAEVVGDIDDGQDKGTDLRRENSSDSEADDRDLRNFRRSPQADTSAHDNQQTPYVFRLRSRTRQLVTQIRAQVRATGLPFDAGFIREARFKRYNPTVPSKPTLRSLLYSCSFGLYGITIAQFGRILKCCVLCDRYICVESVHLHKCNSLPLPDVASEEFSITSELLLKDNFPGLSEADLAKVFDVCDTCYHVYSARNTALHQCN